MRLFLTMVCVVSLLCSGLGCGTQEDPRIKGLDNVYYSPAEYHNYLQLLYQDYQTKLAAWEDVGARFPKQATDAELFSSKDAYEATVRALAGFAPILDVSAVNRDLSVDNNINEGVIDDTKVQILLNCPPQNLKKTVQLSEGLQKTLQSK